MPPFAAKGVQSPAAVGSPAPFSHPPPTRGKAMRLPFLILVLALMLPLTRSLAASWPIVVATESGRVGGTLAGATLAFKGIPYAAPPVGALRWRAPQPAIAWDGVRPADQFGAICWQAKNNGDNGVGEQTRSEDCLTLNIFRPASAAAKLPVAVWIHGGGLVNGSSGAPLYDGRAFAAHGVILVSINYRLGRLGFFVHPALIAENLDDGHLGNYGLMDQIAALRWVKANIASFGGDPARVTIFGESAGAASVEALMISPEARGLFQRAIAQSGYGRGSYPRIDATAPDGRPSASSAGQHFAEALGLPNATAEQLRAVPPETIVEKSGHDPNFGFVLDGHTLTEDLWAAFAAGHEAPVPFIVGSNGLEQAMLSPEAAATAIAAHLNESQKAIMSAYYEYAAGGDLALSSDITFTSQARALARMHEHNGYPTYLYRFTALSSSRTQVWKGAPHASERQYVFDTLAASDWPTDGRDAALARIMNANWSQFAAAGTPNGGGAVNWPAYDGSLLMYFTSDGPVARADPWSSRLDALTAIIDGASD
jgi:para-nitrobenzyl esterase